jgi:hypothetical protein
MAMETTYFEAPTPTTLGKYGFGHGPAALNEVPAMDWLLLLDSQNSVCPICKKVPTPNKSTGKVRFVIDHEHVRGWKAMPPEQRRLYVRGLTCWYCNHAYLGRGITVAKAKGVVDYLSRYLERRPA